MGFAPARPTLPLHPPCISDGSTSIVRAHSAPTLANQLVRGWADAAVDLPVPGGVVGHGRHRCRLGGWLLPAAIRTERGGCRGARRRARDSGGELPNRGVPERGRE